MLMTNNFDANATFIFLCFEKNASKPFTTRRHLAAEEDITFQLENVAIVNACAGHMTSD